MARRASRNTNDAKHTPPNDQDLEHPLTFFLSEADRARVIKALQQYARRRADALLIALGLEHPEGSHGRTGQ